MAALGTYNSNNAPDAGQVILGRGQIRLAKLASDGTREGGMTDIGYISDLALDQSTETVDYTSFYGCQPVKELEIISDQSLGISFNADNATAQNFALWSAGTAHPAVAADGYESPTGTAATVTISSVIKGLWYPIEDDTAGKRLLALPSAATFAATYDPGGGAVAVDAGDLEVDRELGMFRILQTSTDVSTGDDVVFTYTPNAGSAGVLPIMEALKDSGGAYAAEIRVLNGQDCAAGLIAIHRLTIRPSGTTTLLGNDAASLPFEGTISRNSVNLGFSEYYDVIPLNEVVYS